MVVSGGVEVVMEKGKVIWEIGCGEIIGEIGATSLQSRRTVTVRAKEAAEIIEWDLEIVRNNLPALMKKLKDLAWKHVSSY